MKLYVLPVERVCPASCPWCITDFREPIVKEEYLSVGKLKNALAGTEYEKIEITGGGEPTLHPRICEIIGFCSDAARTQMYTCGANLRKVSNLSRLSSLCVSVAHYDEIRNHQIMGVNPDFDFLKSLNSRIKFSLLLHKSGISKKEEVLRYIEWAKDYADSVVIRQLFEHDYKNKLIDEFVSSESLFLGGSIGEYKTTPQGNPVFSVDDLEVEVEYRSCACEMNNPVLHADGRLYRGWSGEKL